MAYFASIGLSPPPSPTSSAASAASGPNPADFLLSLLAASASEKDEGVPADPVDVGVGNVGINSGRPGAAAAAEAAAAGRPFSAGAGASSAGGQGKEDVGDDEDRDELYSISSDTTGGRPYAVTPAQLGRAYYESAASVGIREGVEREAAEAVGAHRRATGGRRWRRRRRRSRKRHDYSAVWLSAVLTQRQVCVCLCVFSAVCCGYSSGVRAWTTFLDMLPESVRRVPLHPTSRYLCVEPHSLLPVYSLSSSTPWRTHRLVRDVSMPAPLSPV